MGRALSIICPAVAYLTVGNGDASSTFAGTVQNTSGQLTLNKTGSGTFGLGGNVTLAGTATVSGGALGQSGGLLQPRPSLSTAASMSQRRRHVGAVEYLGLRQRQLHADGRDAFALRQPLSRILGRQQRDL